MIQIRSYRYDNEKYIVVNPDGWYMAKGYFFELGVKELLRVRFEEFINKNVFMVSENGSIAMLYDIFADNTFKKLLYSLHCPFKDKIRYAGVGVHGIKLTYKEKTVYYDIDKIKARGKYDNRCRAYVIERVSPELVSFNIY